MDDFICCETQLFHPFVSNCILQIVAMNAEILNRLIGFVNSFAANVMIPPVPPSQPAMPLRQTANSTNNADFEARFEVLAEANRQENRQLRADVA